MSLHSNMDFLTVMFPVQGANTAPWVASGFGYY